MLENKLNMFVWDLFESIFSVIYVISIFIISSSHVLLLWYKGIARTQSPTNKNYALKWSTFETIVGVNQPEVQWASLILEEPPSWSWLTSEPGKYAVSGKHMRYNWLSAKGSGWINCPEELMFIFMVPLRYRDVQLWKSDCLPWNNEHLLDRTSYFTFSFSTKALFNL